MPAGRDKHERTIAFAEIAIEQIKALRQPAEPRDYEVWYNYATGYNPSLNKAINDAIARKGNLSAEDIDGIHNAFFSQARLSDRIDAGCSKVVDEIDQVMAMIEQAAGTTSSYTESLVDATQQLDRNVDRESLRAILEGLVESTKEIEHNNQMLEERLKASRQEIRELQASLEAARHESLTDPLTSLANRKSFEQSCQRTLTAAAAGGEPMSLVLADIDHFKTFNDSYGHLTGDQVLRLVAMCIKQNVTGKDIAARFGGEEFAVILPNTGLRDAETVADHIRGAVMSKELMKRSTGESLGRVTISAGVATWQPGDTLASLIERADACLYVAKRLGRNRTVCETDAEIPQLPAAQVA
jgi:diguanylate cyclase